MKRMGWPVLAALCLAAPALAHAADGYVVDNVNLRAGPDPSYPLVDQLQAGTEVDVQGCTDGWEWCDVIAYGNRGWIAGNYIQYQYQDQEVILPDYGAQIGIPIVAFSIGTYWDSYYRNRPFYGDRRSWYSRPYVRRAPPPPPRGFYPGRPGYGRPDGHGNDNNGYRPGQGDQRPGQFDGRDNNGNRPAQGYQRPTQPERGQNYQRPAGAQGQGYQRPVQSGPTNVPRPAQTGRPQPAPTGKPAQPNRQRERDNNSHDDARDKGQ
jgi:uncharacterized protein YraI